jgi:hypothetical protein
VLNGQERSSKVVEKSLEVLDAMKLAKEAQDAATQDLLRRVSEAVASN